jgi:hypothetical protein
VVTCISRDKVTTAHPSQKMPSAALQLRIGSNVPASTNIRNRKIFAASASSDAPLLGPGARQWILRYLRFKATVTGVFTIPISYRRQAQAKVNKPFPVDRRIGVWLNRDVAWRRSSAALAVRHVIDETSPLHGLTAKDSKLTDCRMPASIVRIDPVIQAPGANPDRVCARADRLGPAFC